MNRSDGSDISLKIEDPVAFQLERSILAVTRYSSRITSLELEIGSYEEQGEIENQLKRFSISISEKADGPLGGMDV